MSVTPHVVLPLMPEDEVWNPNDVPDSEIIEAILGRDPAEGEWTERMNTNAKKVNMWWDGKGGKIAAFKLKIGRRDPITDKNAPLKYNWRQTASRMGILMGARGGVDIPDEQKKPVYDRLVKVYKMFDKEPPPFHLTEKHKYFFASPVSLEEDEHLMDIEILREGEWDYPAAPDGVLTLPKEKLEEFVQNFDDKVVGEDLPLDIDHIPSKLGAVGWLKKMWIKTADNLTHLWATLDITDPEVQKAVKEGSLKYFSPSLEYGWLDPETGKQYDLIRSGALTNWPFIKNMKPAVVNFTEIQGGEQKMLTEKELKEREESLETKETDLKDRGTKLDARETDIDAKEEDVKTKEKEMGERKVTIDAAVSKIETHNSFHGLPKAQALELANKAKAGDQKASDLIIKFASGGVYEYSKAELIEELKGVGIEVEDLPQFESKKVDPKLEARVEELEEGKKATEVALKAAIEQLQAVNSELKEEKVEAKLNELGIAPASRELLKGILLAEKGSKIELIEEEGGKKVKKEFSIGEAVLKLISGDEPFKVDLTQKSILTGRKASSVSLREGIAKMMGLSQEEWDKLPKDQRDTFLKKVGGEK